MNNFRNLLKSKKYKIAVWGTGYIGLSTMAYYSKKNIKCIGYDIDKSKVKKINNGTLPISELKDWFGFDIKNFVKKNYLKATYNLKDLNDPRIITHFIAIPTEKNGKPYFKILFKVLKNIIKIKKINPDIKPIIIIESTLTPKFSKKKIIPFFKKNKIKIGEDLLYAVAPRRDWFVEGTKSLENLDRVFGATDKKSSKIAKDILSIVCKKLHEASSHEISEMVKSIENAYRHMEITLANQLSLAFPNDNMREVLKLVGTKWNIGTFYPGFGTGGYCIPLSSKYVLENVKNPKKLTLLRETIKTDNKINLLIARSIVKRRLKKVGILGLSYKGNLKVSVLSPVIPFVKELLKNKIKVKLYDPFYSAKEIKKILGINTFKFPNDLKNFDAIIVATNHSKFNFSSKEIKKFFKNTKYILDANGIWKKYYSILKGKNYHISGDKRWL